MFYRISIEKSLCECFWDLQICGETNNNFKMDLYSLEPSEDDISKFMLDGECFIFIFIVL